MTGTIAGVGMPYTYRPYWKGYDQKEDEEIAEDLFFGCLEVDKAGRPKLNIHRKTAPENEWRGTLWQG